MLRGKKGANFSNDRQDCCYFVNQNADGVKHLPEHTWGKPCIQPYKAFFPLTIRNKNSGLGSFNFHDCQFILNMILIRRSF